MPGLFLTSSVGIPDEIRLEMPAARDIKRIGQGVEFHFGKTNSNFSNLDLDHRKSSIIDHNKRNTLINAMIQECCSSPYDHHTCDNTISGTVSDSECASVIGNLSPASLM
ncbi:hypothetical protein BT69DRAFT_1285848 [Atractiella rhizophila]|nr:hypothetical protein BT69DRAFT_1285848 [Atractiella rhizophila]